MIILGSLKPTPVPAETPSDDSQKVAIERLKAFGGKVEAYDCPVRPCVCPAQTPSVSDPAKPLCVSDFKTVAFFNTNLTDRDLSSLTGLLLQIPNLKRLDLKYTKVKGERLGELAGITTLDELDLSNTPVSGEGLIQLTRFRNLKSISLNNSYLPIVNLNSFVINVKNSLKALRLSEVTVFGPGSKSVDPNEILKSIGNLSELECLKLSQTLAGTGLIKDKIGFDAFKPLAALKKLKVLDISSNNLKDQAIPHPWPFTSLTQLSLAGNTSLTDRSLRSITLHPSDTQPEAIPHPKPALPMKLDLSQTRLTDQGLKKLVKNNAPQLVELYLSRNSHDGRTRIGDRSPVPRPSDHAGSFEHESG